MTASPGLQKKAESAGLGQRRRWLQDRALSPFLWFSLKVLSGLGSRQVRFFSLWLRGALCEGAGCL